MNEMFCYQCQEAAKGTGCTIQGVCGKTSDVANLQDLLIYTLKGILIFTTGMRKAGLTIPTKTNNELGDIGGIPRILDAGQCNDSYSLAIIALNLKEVFNLNDINELPISYNIAWYEQKAVIVLLSLLYLGVKNIHLGPTLPAFLSPGVAKVLVENFGIGGITNVQEDMNMFMPV